MRFSPARRWLLSLPLAIAACAAPVAAQWYGYGGYGYGGYGASTAGEGYARGMAAVVYSAGAASLMTSAAAVNVEQARAAYLANQRVYLDNQAKFTEAYYAKKQAHRSYVASTGKLGQSSQRMATLAKAAPPAPLDDGELDPVTGEIVWPAILREDFYEPSRLKLEGLFSRRAAEGGNLSVKEVDEIVASSQELGAELKRRLKSYPSGAYVHAKRFIERLSREAASL